MSLSERRAFSLAMAHDLLGRYTLGQVTAMVNTTFGLAWSPLSLRVAMGLPAVREVAR